MNVLYPQLACRLCPSNRKPIEGDGPEPCRLFFLGEGPAREEDRHHQVFVGRSGREYAHQYLPLAGLDRSEVRTSNVTKCSCPGYANPSHELAACCADHWLAKELWASEPDILVPMGAVACSIFPGLDLTLRHGIPFPGTYKDWSGWVFPTYHPAAGLHAPEFMVPLQEDFRRLREFRYGRLVIPVDPYPSPAYEHVTNVDRLRSLLQANDTGELGVDTESEHRDDLTWDPWCATFSYRPGTGYLIRSDNHECLRVLAEWIRRLRWLILLHNAPHDLPVLQAMTVEAPRWVDTMSMAYHRMTLPQGLKALAYRLLGMTMMDFDDLCRPFAEAEALTYYKDAERALSKLPKPKRKRGEPVPPLASLKTKVGRLWNDWNKDPNSVDLLKRYEAWDDEDKVLLRELTGRRFPVTSIAKVPFPLALNYACLSRHSRVLTEEGYKPIRTLVESKYSGRVASASQDYHLEWKRVSGWHRKVHDEPIEWVTIQTDLSRVGRWTRSGTRYTADHGIWTPSGWVPAGLLKEGDRIYYPAHELDSVQEQVVIGGLLGDGCITQRNPGGFAAFHVSHNVRQRPYLEWKQTLLGNLCEAPPASFAARLKMIDGRLARCKQFFELSTIQHPGLLRLRKRVYNPEKTVGDWVRRLGPLGLAVWFQDDGTLVDGKSTRLYTLGFSKAGVDHLRAFLLERFNVDSTALQCGHPGRGDQYFIAIGFKSTVELCLQISCYVHPCMRYKLPEIWRNQAFCTQPDRVDNGLVIAKVESIRRSAGCKGEKRVSYCIDVETNHNFVTMGEIAHNCRDADATGRLWPVLRAQCAGIMRKI